MIHPNGKMVIGRKGWGK